MYIEELIIEGFKSYATRTVISGWDSEFNAITGLNGSGKSNILDSICFVLGISTLSHVRANNLQDLVYKRGQAGITKASVTIVFNNSDREKSPLGYENHKQISVTRQIVVNGRNKYIVNGHNKNQQDVANLFQSVQLNVNNPHFLIMQGRITKVLNMKPPEILALIEEAAGTRMFEDRKDKAIKTMGKKDAKLEEINTLLETEIGPKLEKLRTAKRTYLEYQKMATELDVLRRVLIAHDYSKYQAKVQSSGKDLEEKEERIVTLQKMQEVLVQDMREIEDKLAQILEDREKDSAQFRELEAEYKEFAKDLVKIKTQCDLKTGSIADEEKNLANLQKESAEVEASLAAMREKIVQLGARCDSTVNAYEEKTQSVRKLEDLIQTLSTGLAAKEGQDNGYQAQLQEASRAVSTAASAAEQAKMKIAHAKKELQEILPKAKAAEKQNSSLLAESRANKKVTDMLQNELDSLSLAPERESELTQQKKTLQVQANELREQIETLERDLSSFQFEYTSPAPNFDRKSVKGLVAELVSLDPKNHDSSTALEVCAGGKLYNVVVQTEVVGTQLLQNGRLRKRVTMIPLNKINAFRVSAEKLEAARKVAPGKVDLALNLVGYDEELEVAMAYVFGGSFVCRDAETAKRVTFDKAIRTRCITLDGDSYDPSGQLSGGARPTTSGVLVKMGLLKDLRKRYAALSKELEDVVGELEEWHRKQGHRVGLAKSLELKLHEGRLIEERLGTNSSARVIQRAEALKAELEAQETVRKEAMERKAAAVENRAHVEKEMKEFSTHREGKLQALEKELADGKKELAKSAPAVKQMQQEMELAKEEAVQLDKEVVQARERIEQVERVVEALREEERELREKMAGVKRSYDASESALDKERRSLSAYDTESKELAERKKDKKQMVEDCKLETQKLRHELDKFHEDRANAQKVVAELVKAHPWIGDQKHMFGQPNTDYDFHKHDMPDVKKRVKQLEERRKSLERNLDPQVMDKFDRVEKKETQLKAMLATVKKDKRKIQETIGELDKYKREALRKTWEQVDVDFGAIFADLLPGNMARLEPPEGMDITQGLEVKVALGGVWKQSLTELSGGQRSLIALSLILSLLQYKPAPMYILDEVDSALDLSHTQNIGQLIQTRFKNSQFIIVSLKDGMFNNANVLFKTKFRDGVSTVERIAQQREPDRSGGRSTGLKKARLPSALRGAAGQSRNVRA
ncbi:condensin complex component SMC2-like protein [Fimicolochytrium jonesii]|uniref:condensin complex component SMC2-like protein n=1 Tax=Fimicolochytrium jonesii TaxID=1396493 RepID=UPI0022FDB940|nr:condensin complex component SMC2-like protein [Fimicolochytrium jonesii]KAI8815667.1 condensin complex component SMC2-like protein [Fimicolochytrium jonesii]